MTEGTGSLRYIDAAQLDASLSFSKLVDALEAAHKEHPSVSRSVIMHSETTDQVQNSFLCLPAWLPGKAVGAKLVSVFPANPVEHDGLPAVHAIYPVFDGKTGVPVAIIDGTHLTYWKTAADSALGARLLARKSPECLVMIGAGALSPWLIRAHLTVHPTLNEVLIWNRTSDKAERIAQDLVKMGIAAHYVKDLDAALSKGDIISAATSSSIPLVHGKSLKMGAHLDLVGSFTPDMRECDDEAIRVSRVFMDSGIHALETGDLKAPISAGLLLRDDIHDLYQLCTKKHAGRANDDEITLFKNGGGGHLDLMTAMHILEVCV